MLTLTFPMVKIYCLVLLLKIYSALFGIQNKNRPSHLILPVSCTNECFFALHHSAGLSGQAMKCSSRHSLARCSSRKNCIVSWPCPFLAVLFCTAAIAFCCLFQSPEKPSVSWYNRVCTCVVNWVGELICIKNLSFFSSAGLFLAWLVDSNYSMAG